MTFDIHRPVEVHVCFGPEDRAEYPHWLLSLQSSGATECAWIHSTGGPSQGRDYECSTQAKKPVKSSGKASSSLQGYVSPEVGNEVIAIAKCIAH